MNPASKNFETASVSPRFGAGDPQGSGAGGNAAGKFPACLTFCKGWVSGKNVSRVLAVLTFLFALIAAGCGGSGGQLAPSENSSAPDVNYPPQVMTKTLDPAMLNTHYSFTLQATGGAGGNTWSVSDGSLPTWATLDPTTGAISGTPDATGTTTFSVQVTDTRMRTSTAQSLSLTVNPSPLSIYTYPDPLPNATVGIPYSVRLYAHGGVQSYAWTVSSGSLPSWANLDPATGAIIGSPGTTGTASFTIQVTDSQSPPYTATQAFSITVNGPSAENDSKLKGQYAFRFQGVDDATGNQFAILGSFQADGNGNITAGIEDVNGPGGYEPAVSLSGAYNVGADNRGFATFTDPSGGTTVFALAVGSLNENHVATQAGLIEFDDVTGNTGRRGFGSAFLQNTATFDRSNLSGPYVFQMTGQTDKPGTRAVVTGAYTVTANGTVSSGTEDVNKNGNVQSISFTGEFSNTANTSSFGRLTLPITADSGTSNLVAYIVDQGHLLAMTTGQETTSGLESGEMRAQKSASFSAAFLNGASVGYSESTLRMTVGRWTFDGSGNASYSFVPGNASGDEINADYPESGALSYSVSSDGRVTTAGSLPEGALGGAVFYLVNTNEGFVMSMDSSAASGFFEPQTGGGFSNGSLSGSYMLRTVAPAIGGTWVESGELMSPGNGSFSVVSDTSSATGSLTAGYAQSLDLLVLSDGLWIDSEFLPCYAYFISPRKVLLMWFSRPRPFLTIAEK